jgi:hypothetical protein
MKITRRTFVKTSTTAALSVPFVQWGCRADNTGHGADEVSPEELHSMFRDPPGHARVFVRWWWNGDRLEEEEILRELDVMNEAGIGGVEINPIKMPNEADTVGIESIEWLSDKWIEMLKVALRGARERGIICDMIVGSGWPFGGEFLEGDERTQLVAVQTKDLPGGRQYQFTPQELLDDVDPHFHSSYEGRDKELLMLRLVPQQLARVDDGMDFSDQVNQDVITIDVPEGDHVVYWIVKITGFQAVINGAPGAMGPVLNHYSKDAVKKYLNRMSAKLSESIGPLGEYFRAMFCDSLELEGANWCGDMLEEFRARRGYDLAGYLPFILFKVGHMGNPEAGRYGAAFSGDLKERIQQVRYDFETTRTELFRERFVQTFVEWCHQHGVQSRVQAYGRGYHPLQSSMLIDIPECETWLGRSVGEGIDNSNIGLKHYRTGRAYTMINKFVASGARLAGKKVVSCEEITNTSMVFNASLERIKVAGDQSNLSGVTHSVLHGFNYSPPEAPFPGWVRYGTYFNEQNTWWPHFRRWADYKARLSAVFQVADPVADIAILHPTADMWSEHGAQRDPFPTLVYPPYQHQVWEVVHQHGSGCDYVSEKIIEHATIREGRLTYGPRSYRVLMLLEVTLMHGATARKLKEFVQGGGTLICVGKKPAQMPGLKALRDAGGESVPEILDEILRAHPERAAVVEAPAEDMGRWYRSLVGRFDMQPYMTLERPSADISQIYFRTPGLQIFFLSNSNVREPYAHWIDFNVAEDRVPWIWDPETGNRYLYPVTESNNRLFVELEPAGSQLIVFQQQQDGDVWTPVSGVSEDALEIAGPWDVYLQYISGNIKKMQLDDLVDFSADNDLRGFAGVIHYENTVHMASVHEALMLDLGEVHGISELTVNNVAVGSRWYGFHRYDIRKAVVEGANKVRISVTTTLGNYLKSSTDNPVGQRWTRGQPWYPMGLLGPVRIG